MELNDKVAEKIANIFIERIKTIRYTPHATWVKTKHHHPQNISGRLYQGVFNNFFLLLDCTVHKYDHPFYLTLHQAKDLELNFKNAKCVPVMYFNYLVQPQNKYTPKINYKQYLDLTQEEQKQYNIIPIIGYNLVMDISQTDFVEKYPDKLEALIKIPEFSHDYSFAALDTLISKQAWLCPIREETSNRAYYAPTSDYILVPSRTQFPDIKSFYSVLLHEMTHSTGIPDRLNREGFMSNAKKDYAKEELVAELGAAIGGLNFGITREIPDENFAYVQDWLSALNDDPKFILIAIKDAIKAAQVIDKKVEEIKKTIEIQEIPPIDKKIMTNIAKELSFAKNHTHKSSKALKP